MENNIIETSKNFNMFMEAAMDTYQNENYVAELQRLLSSVQLYNEHHVEELKANPAHLEAIQEFEENIVIKIEELKKEGKINKVEIIK